MSQLIQILALLGAPQAEIDELKRRLAETQKIGDREIDEYRSTFC
jgi:hypothetical protein